MFSFAVILMNKVLATIGLKLVILECEHNLMGIEPSG
jgi:hypothetical protein